MRTAMAPPGDKGQAENPTTGASFWAIRLVLVCAAEEPARLLQAAHPEAPVPLWIVATLVTGLAAALIRVPRPGPVRFWLALALLGFTTALASRLALLAPGRGIVTGLGIAAFATAGTLLLSEFATRARRPAGLAGGAGCRFNWSVALWVLWAAAFADLWLNRPGVFEPLHVLLLLAFALAALVFADAALQLDGPVIFWLGFGLAGPAGAALGRVLSERVEIGGLRLGSGTVALLFGLLAVVLVAGQFRRARAPATADERS